MKYLALVGNCPNEAIDKLRSLSEISQVIKLPPDSEIDSPIANHPDTILCIYEKKLYLSENYYSENKELITYICSLCSLTPCPQNIPRCGKYPFDCAFNAFVFDGTVYGNKKALCPELATNSINTRQGYAACSSLCVQKTVFTSDKSVEKALFENGIESVYIDSSEIELDGYKNGFIGGSGGAFDNTLCLFGSSVFSTACRKIEEICKEKNYRFVSLCPTRLSDFGGIKFIPIE